MLWLDHWKFCAKRDCDNRDRPWPWQEQILIRQWLQQSERDPLKLQAMRAFLQQGQSGIQLARMSDARIIEEVAGLLASGHLHLHGPNFGEAETSDEAETGGAGDLVRPTVAAQEVPFPLTDRLPPPQAAPSESSSDPPTFSPDLDGAAQAAALSAAAAGGQPFCPE